MDAADQLRDFYEDAQACLEEVAEAPASDQGTLAWLESQLRVLVTELQVMLADLDSGLSLRQMGFASEDDFNDLVELIQAEITGLRGRIGVLRTVGRGR